uniref:Uncharacterized protein n=1 Tax=Vespula pensylvanica TaxID=30213 RepID=A0A834P1D1_VESPE|nr:hypothetical protein H0235_009147 [Vespula pensylvanica]
MTSGNTIKIFVGVGKAESRSATTLSAISKEKFQAVCVLRSSSSSVGQAPNADQSSLDSNFDLKDPFKWLSIYSEFPSNIYDSLNTFITMRTSYSKEMKLYRSLEVDVTSNTRKFKETEIAQIALSNSDAGDT